jgi:hypothetical protein
MKKYVESAIATSTNNDDTQKRKLQAGEKFFMFCKDYPSTKKYEVDDMQGLFGSDCDNK